ncbi:MAG: hypothetical protein LLG00_01375, partial [Planctomycetaceae bacterium]|nr:hypothetical protein [Planctomycetaceae bacterium]
PREAFSLSVLLTLRVRHVSLLMLRREEPGAASPEAIVGSASQQRLTPSAVAYKLRSMFLAA